MSSIPGRGIGGRGKILATPSVGVLGKNMHLDISVGIGIVARKKDKIPWHSPKKIRFKVMLVRLFKNVTS